MTYLDLLHTTSIACCLHSGYFGSSSDLRYGSNGRRIGVAVTVGLRFRRDEEHWNDEEVKLKR